MMTQEIFPPSFTTSILDELTDPILWVMPVLSLNHAVEDFEVGYANRAAHEAINHPEGRLLGLRVLRDGIPSPQSAEGNFHHFLEVYQSGETREHTVMAHHTGRLIETVRRPYEGGVLSVSRDRRAQREAERKEVEKTRLLQAIIDQAPIGIAVYETVRDAAGTLVDFRIKLYNKKIHSLTGVPEELRSHATLTEVLHHSGAAHNFERIKRCVETGEPLSYEFRSPRANGWLHLSVVRLDDGFMIMISDITEQKKTQQALVRESQFTHRVLDASLNGIFVLQSVVSPQGTITDFVFVRQNRRFEALTGVRSDQVHGRSLLTLYPTIAAQEVVHQLCGVLNTGEPYFCAEYESTTFKRWYSYMVVRLDERHVVVTFQEITEQLLATREIHRQKVLLHNILDNSPSGIAVYTALRDGEGMIYDLQCVLGNEAAERFTGIENTLRFSKTVLQLSPGFENTPLYQKAVAALNRGEHFHTQYYHAPAHRWLLLSVAPVDEEHYITVFTDITETKEAQQQLEHTVEDLRRSNRNLEEFVFAASHDLKEPIRKMLFFTDLLKQKLDGKLVGETGYLFERLETAADLMALLVDDLLIFSQVSLPPKQLSSVDLGHVLELTLKELAEEIKTKKAYITTHPLPTVMGHVGQLQQLLLNLVGNALKYNKPGVPPQVLVTSRTVTGKEAGVALPEDKLYTHFHLLEVRDNGIGFEQEHAEKIFNVFTRLHGNTEYKGTGVGLSIARKVVQNHHGYIWAESTPSVGTSFKILLPQL